MWYVILGVAVIIVGFMLFLHVPSSRLKREFIQKFNICQEESTPQTGVLTKEDIKDLPKCIQKFYEISHILGAPKQSAFCLYSKKTNFKSLDTGKTLVIDYYEYAFGPKPQSLAFIDSSLLGIPFQGLDSFVHGKGGMKGVIAKIFTIFNVRGKEMDLASLATWLAQVIFLPVCLTENDMKWEELSNTSARATFTYYGITVSCEYRFLESGELRETFVKNRGLAMNDGTIKNMPWSVYFGDYKEYGRFYLPSYCKATWHMDGEDVVYYDGVDAQYDMDVTNLFGRD